MSGANFGWFSSNEEWWRGKLTWTGTDLPAHPVGAGHLVFGNGVFVLTVGASTLTSPDGVAWSEHPQSLDFNAVHSMAFGNGVFVAVFQPHPVPAPDQYGPHDDQYFDVATSVDGINWGVAISLPFFGVYNSSPIAFANGQFVFLLNTNTKRNGFGDTDYVRQVGTSLDGAGWQFRPFDVDDTGSSYYIQGPLAYGNGRYLWITDEWAYTSPDLITWTHHQQPDGGGRSASLIFAGSTFVDARVNSGVLTTPDGVTFTGVLGGTRNGAAAYGRGDWVWTELPYLAFGNNRFVAIDAAMMVAYVSHITTTPPPPPIVYLVPTFVTDRTQVAVRIVVTPSVSVLQLRPVKVKGNAKVTVRIEVKVPRYLRMNQRDDGLGVARHPRLKGNGTNQPSSAQTSIRLGTSNRYH